MQLARLTVQPMIDTALREDVGTGDITTMLTIPHALQATGAITVKEPGIVAGLQVAQWVFETVDPATILQPLVCEGVHVETGSGAKVIAHITGRAASLLMAERVALNFLQRMSGIATLTGRCVRLAHTAARRAGVCPPVILDTRKTTPGMRVLEKYAVRMGGGCNHRFGLYDAVLIKNNHIIAAGGIKAAIERARKGTAAGTRVEVEVKDLKQLDEALQCSADVIMLDNMTKDMLREAVKQTAGRARVEISGGVKESNIEELAGLGVDYISIGALTHSARALDIGMQITASMHE